MFVNIYNAQPIHKHWHWNILMTCNVKCMIGEKK